MTESISGMANYRSIHEVLKTPPIEGQVMLKNVEFDSGYDVWYKLDKTLDPKEAQAITSRVNGSDKHKVILDIDFPVKAVPSSTPGHTHLYIDKELDWEYVLYVIHALAAAGIVERGYADACEDQGFTTVRLPWIKKEGVE